jgi:hypothetical protein
MDCCKGKKFGITYEGKEVGTIECTEDGLVIKCTEEGKEMCGKLHKNCD